MLVDGMRSFVESDWNDAVYAYFRDWTDRDKAPMLGTIWNLAGAVLKEERFFMSVRRRTAARTVQSKVIEDPIDGSFVETERATGCDADFAPVSLEQGDVA